jgi:nucleoside-diphosphate-sugar epimerase
MHVMIIRAAGMIGRKRTARLAEAIVPDLSAPGAASALAALKPDMIFHLAAGVTLPWTTHVQQSFLLLNTDVFNNHQGC